MVMNNCAQLLFPVLMVAMVWRTIAVRVRPDDLLVFRLHGSEGGEGDDELPMESRDDQGSPRPQAEDGEVPPTADEPLDAETGRSRRGLWQEVCCFLCPQTSVRAVVLMTYSRKASPVLRDSVVGLAPKIARMFCGDIDVTNPFLELLAGQGESSRENTIVLSVRVSWQRTLKRCRFSVRVIWSRTQNAATPR